MSQMTQMAEDLSRSAGGSPKAILNAGREGRCEATRGSGRALCDKDLWPSVSSVDGHLWMAWFCQIKVGCGPVIAPFGAPRRPLRPLR
jgi:hypothetical protein